MVCRALLFDFAHPPLAQLVHHQWRKLEHILADLDWRAAKLLSVETQSQIAESSNRPYVDFHRTDRREEDRSIRLNPSLVDRSLKPTEDVWEDGPTTDLTVVASCERCTQQQRVQIHDCVVCALKCLHARAARSLPRICREFSKNRFDSNLVSLTPHRPKHACPAYEHTFPLRQRWSAVYSRDRTGLLVLGSRGYSDRQQWPSIRTECARSRRARPALRPYQPETDCNSQQP